MRELNGRPAPNTDKADFFRQINRVECNNDDRLRSVERLYKNLGVADEDIVVEKFDNVANVVLMLDAEDLLFKYTPTTIRS